MFLFVMRRLRLLAKIPAVPQVFEGLMMFWYFLFARSVLGYVDTIERTVTSWPGVTSGMHRYGGTEFTLGRREIGHVHANGLVDILLTKALKEQVVREGRAFLHHIFPKSNWISRPIRSEIELELALGLLRLSYERIAALQSDAAA